MSKTNSYSYMPACPNTPLSTSIFSLLNRQQPIHARISTNNERDRRPIDPPPIIQIKLNNATPQETDTFHQNSYFFMCANLAHATNDNEIYTPTHNALSGQTVSSMYKLKDIDNHDGAFFIFGDLSVKVEGNFRLKLSLFQITSTGSVCLQSVFTGPFVVYPAKKFPGTLDSTFLSRSFSDQSARIRIRKENRAQAPSMAVSRKRKIVDKTNHLQSLSPPSKKLTVCGPSSIPAYSSPEANYYERRSSIASNGTESCSSEESSPTPRHFLTPTTTPLPCLSSQQYYQKPMSTSYFPLASPPLLASSPPPTVYHYSSHSYSPIIASGTSPRHDSDHHIQLPPLRSLVDSYRQGISSTTTTEQDAVVAMMQLSQPSFSESRKAAFSRNLIHLN